MEVCRKQLITIFFIVIPFIFASCSKSTPPVGQPVNVIKAHFQPYEVTYPAVGTIDSRYLPTVVARVDSVVENILVEPGQKVEKDQPIVLLNRSVQLNNLKIAEAEYHAAKIEEASAGKEYLMYKKLLASGAVSKLMFVKGKGAYDVATAKLRTASARLENTQMEYLWTTVRSPINGRVAAVDVSVGDRVQVTQATKLVSIVNNNQVIAAFPVSQAKAKLFHVGQPIYLTGPDSTQVLASEITSIAPAIEKESGVFEVLISFYNVYNWKIGSALSGKIVTEVAPKALVLPDSAVILRKNGEVIYATQDNVAYEIPVQVIQREANQIVVTANLKENVDIVTVGGSYLQNGSKVQIISGDIA